jgi:hypothetical protein
MSSPLKPRVASRFAINASLAALALIGATTIAAHPAAGRSIVPGASIGGIRLAMTRTEVMQRLGRPSATARLRGALGARELLLSYPQLTVLLSYQDANFKVTSVSTTRPSERMSDGIGVGTTMATLKAQFRPIRCDRASPTQETCQSGNPRKAGSHLTTFFLTRGRISKIAVSLSINS